MANINEIIDTMETDLLLFVDEIFGSDRVVSKEENEQLDRMKTLVTKLAQNPNVDYDLIVTVNYRLGPTKKGMGVTKTLRKSLTKALAQGFKIPAEATYVEISVRPIVMVEGLDGEVVKKQYKTSFFDRKIYLGDCEIAPEEAKKKYGLAEEDNLLPISDFAGNSILKFEETTYDNSL